MDESRQRDRHGLEAGTKVGDRYVIERLLARGGMGEVYVATQKALGRTVALKVMRAELLGDETAVKRFLREAVTVSKLEDPHTIRLFDFGALPDGTVFMAMELVRGQTLGEQIRARGPLAPSRTVAIVRQISRS